MLREKSKRILKRLGLLSTARRVYWSWKRQGRAPLEFSQRHLGQSERVAAILENMPRPGSWVLDVGSNTGEVANSVAQEGHFVLGVEIHREEHKMACETAGPRTAFMLTKVDPEFLASTLHWDVILLLSVLHRIYAVEGEEAMREVLKLSGMRAQRAIFIEGSTRHDRYTDEGFPAPGFSNLDVDSCLRWHEKLITASLGDEWEISKSCSFSHDQIEPKRVFFVLTKTNNLHS